MSFLLVKQTNDAHALFSLSHQDPVRTAKMWTRTITSPQLPQKVVVLPRVSAQSPTCRMGTGEDGEDVQTLGSCPVAWRQRHGLCVLK